MGLADNAAALDAQRQAATERLRREGNINGVHRALAHLYGWNYNLRVANHEWNSGVYNRLMGGSPFYTATVYARTGDVALFFAAPSYQGEWEYGNPPRFWYQKKQLTAQQAGRILDGEDPADVLPKPAPKPAANGAERAPWWKFWA